MLAVTNSSAIRINSFITNTYSTIRAIYEIIARNNCFLKVFFVLYDSYSL